MSVLVRLFFASMICLSGVEAGFTSPRTRSSRGCSSCSSPSPQVTSSPCSPFTSLSIGIALGSPPPLFGTEDESINSPAVSIIQNGTPSLNFQLFGPDNFYMKLGPFGGEIVEQLASFDQVLFLLENNTFPSGDYRLIAFCQSTSILAVYVNDVEVRVGNQLYTASWPKSLPFTSVSGFSEATIELTFTIPCG